MRSPIQFLTQWQDMIQRPANRFQLQTGFGLFEALVAALILAIAVAGVLSLHTHNLRQTAGNFELQRAYWVLSNAQQRYQITKDLSSDDIEVLNTQLRTAGFKLGEIALNAGVVTLSWSAAENLEPVRRNGCIPAIGANSCISVRVQ